MALETMALFIGTILVLPWSLKQAGIFDKVKQWYKVLIAGLAISMISLTFGMSGLTTLLGQDLIMWISLATETVSLILVVISLLGIAKNLLIDQ